MLNEGQITDGPRLNRLPGYSIKGNRPVSNPAPALVDILPALCACILFGKSGTQTTTPCFTLIPPAEKPYFHYELVGVVRGAYPAQAGKAAPAIL